MAKKHDFFPNFLSCNHMLIKKRVVFFDKLTNRADSKKETLRRIKSECDFYSSILETPSRTRLKALKFSELKICEKKRNNFGLIVSGGLPKMHFRNFKQIFL